MSESLYSIGTWDGDLHAYTPQEGIEDWSINVPLNVMRCVLRALRRLGYSAHRRRSERGDYDNNDPFVLVERTDGRPEKEILESWKR